MMTAIASRAGLRWAVTARQRASVWIPNSGTLPRVTLLETEFQRAVVAAELKWVDGVVNDLRTGTLARTESDFTSAAWSYDLE
jgi:hypothetical protein